MSPFQRKSKEGVERKSSLLRRIEKIFIEPFVSRTQKLCYVKA